MDLVAYGTLVAAIIAAVAAVWSSVVSHRQLNLTRGANAPPFPVVNARLSSVDDQPDWAGIDVHLTNRADVPLTVLSLEMERPKPCRLLPSDEAYEDPKGYNPKKSNTFPLDRARKEISIGYGPGPVGSTRFSSAGDVTHFSFYAYDPGELLRKEDRPQLAMKLRWDDHEASIFLVIVTITRY
ncbi:hypothetical protein NKJ71_16520 [Mesorhizobium sp. M0050]|uniref:hypothetical protein n=1 Tax=Mesorhizobium sp. M0050 TaxID=2956861 RepID=UPI00333E0988